MHFYLAYSSGSNTFRSPLLFHHGLSRRGLDLENNPSAPNKSESLQNSTRAKKPEIEHFIDSYSASVLQKKHETQGPTQ